MNPDFGTKHLTGLVWLCILIAVVLGVLLSIKKKRKLGENFDKAVIRYTCYFMWAWEIVKTIFMVNTEVGYGPVGHYPVWMAPFHLCSMGLYAYLIIGSKHSGKLAVWVKPYAYTALTIGGAIIMIMPASSGILGAPADWSFCYENILPYQSWLYHGSLIFVSLYMVFSGFFRPVWMDILRAIVVFCVTAAGAQTLNYVFDGSGADFMTLRYGNGNPFAFLLDGTPALYYLVLTGVAFGGVAALIAGTKAVIALVELGRKKTCA